MKQQPRRMKSRQLTPKVISGLQVLALVIVFSAGTGLIVNFFDNIHYNNLLSQVNDQVGTAQTELGNEHYDLKFLINNSGQLNCYDLHSSFTRNLCQTHNSKIKNNL